MRRGEWELVRFGSALAPAYTVKRELGRGGMATVLLAFDHKHGRHVAVKVMRPEVLDSASTERFLREIRVTARLAHPFILPLLDSGEVLGLPYYVMPFVDGESLRQRLDREGRLPVDEVASIACDVADALAYAHDHGVLHRDVKPGNIMLAGGRALVADFGIARALDAAGETQRTEVGVVVGTRAYMSPEQAEGRGDLDGRTDVYSLGRVLDEMLGRARRRSHEIRARVPGSVTTTSETADQAGDPIVPPALSAIVRRMTERDPEHRCASAREVTSSLRVWARDTASVEPWNPRIGEGTGRKDTSPPPTPVMPQRRRRGVDRRGWLVGSVVMLAMLGTAAATWWTPRSASPDPMEGRQVDPRRIVLLPFDTQGVEPGLAPIMRGLQQRLAHELTGVDGIEVVWPGFGTVPTGAVLDSLITAVGAGSLIAGSVHTAGARLRLVVQLVDTRSRRLVRSVEIAGVASEPHSLEDSLVRHVPAALRRSIGAVVRLEQSLGGTSSARARALMTQAQQLREDATTIAESADILDITSAAELLARADSLLSEAHAADRHWAMAVRGRAVVALNLASLQRGVARQQTLRRALEHSRADLAITQDSAEALTVYSRVMWRQAAVALNDATAAERLGEAERAARRAVELDPELAGAWSQLSIVLAVAGHFREAELAAGRALRLDTYLDDAADVLYELYNTAVLNQNIAAAQGWCKQGREDHAADVRFVDCELQLLLEDRAATPDPHAAWRLVDELHRLDPPARARAAGREYLPAHRAMVAAALSARAGDTVRAIAALTAARRSLPSDDELQVDFLYDEAILLVELGRHEEAAGIVREYLRRRPLLAGLVARDHLLAPLRLDTATR